MALGHINKKSSVENCSPVSAREIADKFGIPYDTTSSVLQTLARAKILESQQGISGGYHLIQDLTHLSLLELTELIEKKNFYVDCQERKCDLIDACNIKKPLDKLHKELRSIFAQMKVGNLLGNTE